jgi:hypothetical protein
MVNTKLRRIIPLIVGGASVLTVASIVVGSLLGTQSSKHKVEILSSLEEGLEENGKI